jgi:fucose permease
MQTQVALKKIQLEDRVIKLLLISGTFFMAGLIITIFGPSMQFIMNEYNIGMGIASLFITCYGLGRFFSVLISGYASDKMGGKLFITLGSIFMAAGCLGFALTNDYRLGFAAILIAGLGYGAIDSSGVVLIANLYPNKDGVLSFGHMFYGIGCFVGPMLAGFILDNGQSWRYIFILTAIVGSLLSIGLVFSKFNTVKNTTRADNSKQKLHTPKLISPIILMTAGMLLAYTGISYGLTTWFNKYLRDILNFSIISAATTLSVYNAGIISGRFICSYLTERLGTSRLLLCTSSMAFVSIMVLVLSKSAFLSILFVGFTGFFLAGIFPTAITLAGKRHPDYIGKISGFLISFASLGSILVPFMMGSVAETWGISVGIKSIMVLGTLLMVLAVAVQKMVNEKA